MPPRRSTTEQPRIFLDGEDAKRFMQEFVGMRDDMKSILVTLRDAIIPRITLVESVQANDRALAARSAEVTGNQIAEVSRRVTVLERRRGWLFSWRSAVWLLTSGAVSALAALAVRAAL